MYNYNEYYWDTFSQNNQGQYGGQRHHPYFRRGGGSSQQPYFKGENIFSVAYKNSYMTMLWDQTKQLPKEAFKLVEKRYEESGFYLDVRLHLASFVESKFMPNMEVDDATRANLANQLLGQLDAKIAATPNDPDKFLTCQKLKEMHDNLKVHVLAVTFCSERVNIYKRVIRAINVAGCTLLVLPVNIEIKSTLVDNFFS